MAENSYSTKVYSTLKDNIDGFNKTEDEFNESLKDPAYVSKVHKALSETIDGFNKSESEFSSALGYPKQSAPSQGAESGLSNFIQAPKTSGLSDYTGKPVSTSTSPSASTSSVGVGSNTSKQKSFTPLQKQTLEKISFDSKQGQANADLKDFINPNSVIKENPELNFSLDDLTLRTKVVRGLLDKTTQYEQELGKGVELLKQQGVNLIEEYKANPTPILKAQIEQKQRDYEQTLKEYNKQAFIKEGYEKRILQTSDSIKKIANSNVPDNFYAGLYSGMKGNVNSYKEAYDLFKKSKAEQIQYAKDKALQAPTKEEGTTAQAGEMIGGVIPDIAQTIGFSLLGLPSVGVYSVAARQGAQQASDDFVRAFNKAKTEGVKTGKFDANGNPIMREPTDDEAYDIATNAAGVGGVTGFVEGMVGAKAQNLATSLINRKVASKGAQVIANKIADTGIDAATAVGLQTARNAYDNAQGLNTKLSEGLLENAAGEILLSAPTNAYHGTKEYKQAKQNERAREIFESVVASKDDPDALNKLQQNLDIALKNKLITEQDYVDITRKTQEYQRVIPTIPDEIKNKQGAADLIIERDELEAKKENTDKAFQKPIDEALNVINEKITNVDAEKEEFSKPIKYTSPTDDLYGYVEENGVKRDLTKQEFEDYGKVDMEQSMEAAPTEESKGVGEDTQAFTTDAKFKSEPIELSIEPSRVEEPTEAFTTETKPTSSEESKVKEVEIERRREELTTFSKDRKFIKGVAHEIQIQKKFGIEGFDVDVSNKSNTSTGFLYSNVLSEHFDTLEEAIEYANQIIQGDKEYIKKVDAELAKLKTDETEATKNKEASVPSKQAASGEDTSKGEQQKAEVVEGDKLTGEQVKNKLQEIEKQPVKINITQDANGKMEQTSQEVIDNIKAELDKTGLPYSDVVSNDKGSTYFVVTKDGQQHEILKVLQSGGKLVPTNLTKAKWINHLIKTEKDAVVKAVEQPLKVTPTEAQPTEGSRVELPNDFKNGLPKKMVFSQGEWKQEIGKDLSKVGEKQQEEANNKFKELNTKEDAIQESKAEGVLSREQGKAGEAGGEREGVGQGEQGQEPTKASQEEVTPQAGSVGVGGDAAIAKAIEEVDKARGVKYWMQPEFIAETKKYPQTGNPNSIIKIEQKDSDDIVAYDENGKIVGSFSIAKEGKEKGAFKIVVREDAQRKGWGKEILNEAERQGIDVVGSIDKNSFTSSGRDLVRNWLNDKQQSLKETPKAAKTVEQLRAEEQAELDTKIPNAEKYRVDGKVERSKLTNDADRKAFDEVYDKYDKLITPLLEKEASSAGVGDVEAFQLVENEGKWKATTKTYKGRETGNWVYNFLDKKQKREYDKIRDKADSYGTKEDAEKALKLLQEFENNNKDAFEKAKQAIDDLKQTEAIEEKAKTDRQKVYNKTASQISELSDSDFEKLINLIDKDVKSALEKRFGERIERKPLFKNRISEDYHKAKKDGSNPELVKAVESLLSKEQAPTAKEFTSEEDKKIKDIAIEANTKVGSYVKSVPTGKKDRFANNINEFEATNPFTNEKKTFKKQSEATEYVINEIAKANTKKGREEIFQSLLSKETPAEATKPTEKAQEGKAEQDYQEAISKKSERAKNNAKEKFINDNFDKIVSQLMLENKIKRKC